MSQVAPIVWVVVLVQSGIPVSAEVYTDLEIARKREQELSAQMDENDDAVGIFETKLGAKNSEPIA